MSNEIKVQEDYFTIVRNDVLKDKLLSARAKGVYCYLISNAKSFRIYKTELHNHFSEGRDAIIKAFNELVSAGWIVEKEVKRADGKFSAPDYHVYRYKETPTHSGKPVTGKPIPVNQELISINNNKYQDNNSTSASANDSGQKITKIDPIPYDHILTEYKKALPELPQPRKLTEKRKRALKKCWKDDNKHQTLDFWRQYFNYVSKSKFLMGEEKKWQSDFDFLTNLDNLMKVTEGKYHKEYANS